MESKHTQVLEGLSNTGGSTERRGNYHGQVDLVYARQSQDPLHSIASLSEYTCCTPWAGLIKTPPFPTLTGFLSPGIRGAPYYFLKVQPVRIPSWTGQPWEDALPHPKQNYVLPTAELPIRAPSLRHPWEPNSKPPTEACRFTALGCHGHF